MPLQVLVIEDDEQHARLWTIMLTRHSKRAMHVDIVRTEADALDKLHAPDSHYDLVIMDPGLPDTHDRKNEAILEVVKAATPAAVKILTGGVDTPAIAEALELTAGMFQKSDLTTQRDMLEQLFGDKLDGMIQAIREARRKVDATNAKLEAGAKAG